ncbi:MAG: hypothetical protein GYB54_06670 [Gammaproteobacteria bacterium]|nr:hypothetical protein [Gammaproteobacteria bacterium]
MAKVLGALNSPLCSRLSLTKWIEALKDRGFGLNELYGLTKGRIETEAGWDAPLEEDVIEALFDGNHP